MLGGADRVLCAGTALQKFAPGRVQPTFVEWVTAASEAGFSSVSLWPGDYDRARASGVSDADIRTLMADLGLQFAELDPYAGWLPDPAGHGYGGGYSEEDLYRLAGAVGGRSLNLFTLATELDLDFAAEAFAGVCDRAAEHGLLVHIEFLPQTAIGNVSTAWDLVRRADRPNAGILVDAYHRARSGESLEALRSVPGEKIVGIHLDDVAPEPWSNWMEESLHGRLFPGEGAGEVAALMTTLNEIGCDAPIGIEVLNDSLAETPVSEIAQRSFQSISSVLSA